MGITSKELEIISKEFEEFEVLEERAKRSLLELRSVEQTLEVKKVVFAILKALGQINAWKNNRIQSIKCSISSLGL